MSIGGKLRFLGFCIRDFLKFNKEDRVVSNWKDIETTLSSYDKGWKKVEKSLKDCLEYATENCEFYKQYKGKPLSEFPVLTKTDFIENFDKIKNPLFKDDELHKSSTSGSTGTPFKVVQNKAKRNRVLAELKYFGQDAGYNSHEKMIFYRSGGKISFLTSFLTNVWQPDTSVLSAQVLSTLLKKQLNANAILGYPLTLEKMVNLWKKSGFKGSNSVKVVITSGELLTDDARTACSEFWKNSVVVSRYSNMENGIIAQEKINQEGKFFINWSSYYLEILKLDSDEPAECGELGRIVITDMYNKAFPMIRYDNGDVGCFLIEQGQFPILSDIQGRRADMIYDTSGNIVSFHAISKRMWGIDSSIKQWQFAQEGEKEYKIIFSSENEAYASSLIKEKISELREILGDGACIELEHINEIPVLKSTKRKVIIQNYKGEK